MIPSNQDIESGRIYGMGFDAGLLVAYGHDDGRDIRDVTFAAMTRLDPWAEGYLDGIECETIAAS